MTKQQFNRAFRKRREIKWQDLKDLVPEINPAELLDFMLYLLPRCECVVNSWSNEGQAGLHTIKMYKTGIVTIDRTSDVHRFYPLKSK